MQGHLIRTVYNFIENNDLSVANFIYDQKVNLPFQMLTLGPTLIII